VDVQFISFEDVKNGALKDFNVVINAGRMGDAWSGGDAWKCAELVSELTRFVYEGGAFIGVGEPAAIPGFDHLFRLSHVLGVDEDDGARVCHGRWAYEVNDTLPISVDAESLGNLPHIYLTDGDTRVLCEKNGIPQMTVHDFGKGKGVYMSHFNVNPASTRMLLETLLYVCGLSANSAWLSDSALVETAYYPADRMLVALNNAEEETTATLYTDHREEKVVLKPLETRMIQL